MSIATTNLVFIDLFLFFQVKVSTLEGKVVALYFSANWYPPCRTFTQILINVYNDLKRNGAEFEVIFVSSDEDLDAFNNYRACMPWLAVPFSDLETKKSLNKKFDVEGIPCLIVLQPDGDGVTTYDGVELVYRYGKEAFPFTKWKLEELRKEEEEKHERQTLVNLLTNDGRDYVFSHTTSDKVTFSFFV